MQKEIKFIQGKDEEANERMLNIVEGKIEGKEDKFCLNATFDMEITLDHPRIIFNGRAYHSEEEVENLKLEE